MRYLKDSGARSQPRGLGLSDHRSYDNSDAWSAMFREAPPVPSSPNMKSDFEREVTEIFSDDNELSPRINLRCVLSFQTALKTGYRHIDGAWVYGVSISPDLLTSASFLIVVFTE
jgi:hypothetical protein